MKGVVLRVRAAVKFLSVLGTMAVFASTGAAASQVNKNEAPETTAKTETSSFYYYYKYKDTEMPVGFIELNASNLTSAESIIDAVKNISDTEAVVLNEDNNWSEWSFDVEKEGRYTLYFDYCPLMGNGQNIVFSVESDGEIPYGDLSSAMLPRVWEDGGDVGENGFRKDSAGNDIRPEQVEKGSWTTCALYDSRGLYSEPYFIYLTSGAHTLRITLGREAAALKSIRLGNEEPPSSYGDYISSILEAKGECYGTGEIAVRQAESSYTKSKSTLYPTYDNNNAFTQPNDPSAVYLNTIGQSGWGTNGDYISWRVNVPKSGLYRIAFRARQNGNKGMYSYRALTVNGKLPFSEAASIAFPYDPGWYVKSPGGEEPYWFYLEDGDILTLRCTTAEMSEVLRSIQDVLLKMNRIYRSVIIITSVEPDIYRDYSLEKKIPDLADELNQAAQLTEEISNLVFSVTNTRGSQAAVLDYVSKILKELADKPYTVAERLSTFKGAIENMGSLILTLSAQPLELDYLAFLPVNSDIPKANGGFFTSLKFYAKQFTASFISDYNSVGSKKDYDTNSTIKVWVTTGRDQAKIISDLLTNSFIGAGNANIDLAMVDTGATLIKAGLAGKGPDAALFMPMDTPMNLAARGALLNIAEYDLTGIKEQFYSSALEPFHYNGGLYALPETQVFDVLFCRMDVFDEFSLKIPSTWKDFYKAMEILQKSNLLIGIPEINAANMGVSFGIETFNKFLLQNGGKYYNEDMSKTCFDTEEAFEAFSRWVALYTEYGLPREYDFYSRFRTGEMPMAIQSYNLYNKLAAAAPELNGLWSIAPIPGTVGKNGEIDRSQSAVMTGCIMLKSAKEKNLDNETFEFLKWWVSAETQASYSSQLEASLGIAARNTPANKEVMEKIGWTSYELNTLKAQWEQVMAIPQIPGNYAVSRELTSAFRSAVSGKNRARRALTVYNTSINDEISRKRSEFDLH